MKSVSKEIAKLETTEKLSQKQRNKLQEAAEGQQTPNAGRGKTKQVPHHQP
jgi:hypothetical protein